MVSPIYASLLALWIFWLTINVVKARRANKVKYGDGGVESLMIARSAHSNATETIPIALILLFSLEFNGGMVWLVHLLGITLILGRLIHAKGILSQSLSARTKGMQITIVATLSLAVANLLFLPYEKLITF